MISEHKLLLCLIYSKISMFYKKQLLSKTMKTTFINLSIWRKKTLENKWVIESCLKELQKVFKNVLYIIFKNKSEAFSWECERKNK